MNKLWDFLCSVKLTIFLLVILAGTSIIGTVIPQEGSGGQFVRSLSPFFEKIVLSFQLYDMYHSFWFQLIILLLTLNLIACTMNRLPATLKLYGKEPKPDREKIFENIPRNRIIEFNIKRSGAASRIRTLINKQFKRTVEKEGDSSNYFYTDKGRYSLFGVYFVHLSVILILIGAIIGSFLGFKGFVNIIEGDSTEYVELRNQPAHTHKDLGFTVNCDKFSVDFYENGTPKEYTSQLRFSIGEETVKQGLLRVNHPMTFKGITFYQSSYGSVPGNSAHLMISQKNETAEPSIIHAERGKPLPLPNGDGEFQLAEVIEDFMRLGPAVSILIKPAEGDIIQFYLFENHDSIKKKMPEFFDQYAKMNPSIFAPYTFALADIEKGSYYTGLQVNKDPGIFFVYLGFFVIVVGLFITFFSSHRKVWIKIIENQDKAIASIAGSANKNPVGLERELDRLAEQLKNIMD